MKTFKTFAQVEESFKQEEQQKTTLLSQSKILESFAELLSQHNITESSQITEEIMLAFVSKLNEKKNFIELDTTDLDDRKFQDFLSKNKIEFSIVDEEGPSGYPLVKFEGEEEKLKEMYLNFWDKQGADDFKEFVGQYYS